MNCLSEADPMVYRDEDRPDQIPGPHDRSDDTPFES